MIRVLVAEDSPTVRALLVAVLAADPEIRIAGEARDGVEAVELAKRLRPDAIVMDVHMPRLDGFEATKAIMAEAPAPIVIVSSSVNVRDVETSMRALRAGALTILAKPPGPDAPGFEEEGRRFVETVKAMADVKVVRHRVRAAAPPSGPRGAAAAPARVVAIAASTGGPAALARVLADLPPDFPAPVLVVQHISPGFVDGLASWLHAEGPLRVKVAEDGEPLAPHTVYLAPDGRHLGTDNGSRIALAAGPPLRGYRPSASRLFESVARAFGPASLALVLTGMGDDGVEGLAEVRRAGGRVVAQDRATSVVFGMPGAAAEAGLADLVIPLPAIGSTLLEAVVNGGI